MCCSPHDGAIMPTSEWITISTQVKSLGVLDKWQDELVQHPVEGGLSFCVGDDHPRSARRARQIATVVVGELYHFRAGCEFSPTGSNDFGNWTSLVSAEWKRFVTDEKASV